MSKRTSSSHHAGKIWCRYGAFAPYFFGYGADTAHLLHIFFGYGADMARLLRIFWIWCRYGAFAPYFFGFFWLAYALNQRGSFAVALYLQTMVCS